MTDHNEPQVNPTTRRGFPLNNNNNNNNNNQLINEAGLEEENEIEEQLGRPLQRHAIFSHL